MTQGNLFDDRKTPHEKFMEDLHSGEKLRCPTCNKWCQIYGLTLTRSMVKCLLRLDQLCRINTWVHYEEFNYKGTYGKLKHWMLIEQGEPEPDDDSKKQSGYWRITEAGKKYLNGELLVTKTYKIYDDEIVGIVDPELVNVNHAWKETFHYGEYMNMDINQIPDKPDVKRP